MDLLTPAEITNRACGIDAHCSSAFGPRTAAQAQTYVRTIGNLQSLLTVLKTGQDARYSKQRRDRRIIRMKSDNNTFLFGNGYYAFDEVGVICPHFLRLIFAPEYESACGS